MVGTNEPKPRSVPVMARQAGIEPASSRVITPSALPLSYQRRKRKSGPTETNEPATLKHRSAEALTVNAREKGKSRVPVCQLDNPRWGGFVYSPSPESR